MAATKPAIRKTNASDAIVWKRCRRQAWFDLRATGGVAPDPFERLVMQAGIAHEKTVLTSLGEHHKATNPKHTAELMAARVPVIYQPKFEDDALAVIAQPDFLLLEDDRYRAADAKLARSMRKKPELRIQLAVYQRALETHLPTQALLADNNIEFTDEKNLAAATVLQSLEILCLVKILSTLLPPVCDGRSGDVAAQPLQLVAFEGLGTDARVDKVN